MDETGELATEQAVNQTEQSSDAEQPFDQTVHGMEAEQPFNQNVRGSEAERPFSQNERGARIPFPVKAVLWDKLLFFLFSGLLLTGMSSPVVILIYHAVKDGRLAGLGPPILLLTMSVPAIFLCTAFVAFVILLRRKLKTGGFLLPRVELNARVASSLQPQPLRKRIVAAVIYCLIASDETYVATISHRYAHFTWSFAVFMWLIAAFFIVNLFRPLGRKRAIDNQPEDEMAAEE